MGTSRQAEWEGRWLWKRINRLQNGVCAPEHRGRGCRAQLSARERCIIIREHRELQMRRGLIIWHVHAEL